MTPTVTSLKDAHIVFVGKSAGCSLPRTSRMQSMLSVNLAEQIAQKVVVSMHLLYEASMSDEELREIRSGYKHSFADGEWIRRSCSIRRDKHVSNGRPYLGLLVVSIPISEHLEFTHDDPFNFNVNFNFLLPGGWDFYCEVGIFLEF